jgi:hypothetical protein
MSYLLDAEIPLWVGLVVFLGLSALLAIVAIVAS